MLSLESLKKYFSITLNFWTGVRTVLSTDLQDLPRPLLSNTIIFYRMLRRTNSNWKSVNAPSVVHKYNETMGGVDLGDQLIGQYEPQFRSLKLWKNIFLRLIMEIMPKGQSLAELHARVNIRRFNLITISKSRYFLDWCPCWRQYGWSLCETLYFSVFVDCCLMDIYSTTLRVLYNDRRQVTLLTTTGSAK
jgi:hypothetical protein